MSNVSWWHCVCPTPTLSEITGHGKIKRRLWESKKMKGGEQRQDYFWQTEERVRERLGAIKKKTNIKKVGWEPVNKSSKYLSQFLTLLCFVRLCVTLAKFKVSHMTKGTYNWQLLHCFVLHLFFSLKTSYDPISFFRLSKFSYEYLFSVFTAALLTLQMPLHYAFFSWRGENTNHQLSWLCKVIGLESFLEVVVFRDILLLILLGISVF